MACPRCGGDLERYALADAESVVCESCGYIGVPVEHDSEPVVIESWDEALERFDTRQAAVDAVAAGDVDVSVPEEATDEAGETDGDGEATDETGVGDSEESEVTDEMAREESEDDSDDDVACPVCTKRFDTRQGMRIHRGLVHED
jgi:hypothetical protein